MPECSLVPNLIPCFLTFCSTIEFNPYLPFKFLIFYHSSYIHNTQLSVVNQCKYLGILIQSDLKWNSHVNYVTAKANQTLAMLKRNIKLASQKIKDKAYKSLIRP